MKKFFALVLTLALLLGSVNAFALTEVDASSDRGIVPQGQNAEGTWDVNPVIEGESPTTGESWTGDYIPVLVNIDNIKQARPQWGIGKADIVYEMPIDRLGYTRLMALFMNEHPDTVGPVRSARVMHADMRQEWDAAWVFCGGQEASGSNVFARIRQLGVPDQSVNLAFNLQGSNGSAFNSSREDRKSPHHHQLQMTKLVSYLNESGYDFPERPFLFTDESVSGDDALYVETDFGSGHSNAYYRFDAEKNAYLRYITEDNKPYVDEKNPSETLAYENLIIQWTTLKYYDGDGSRPNLIEVGEGNADFFMTGKHVQGYWVRVDINHRTVFFDSEGNEISLQRGRSWIVLASDKFLDVRYE